MRQLAYNIRAFFYQLLRVDALRWVIAFARYVVLVKILRRLRTLDLQTGDIIANTVSHNLIGLHKVSGLAVPRAQLLAYPLAAIRMSKSTPILVVGPRSEGELLLLKGLGFRNVRGLDLISYSPWVDLGDMHAMPYADNSMGVIMYSWCMAYSDNRGKMASEAVRIVKPGGIVAIGAEYTRETPEEVQKRIGYVLADKEPLQSTQQMLSAFGGSVDRVFFRHDIPEQPVDKWQLLLHFSVKK